MLSRYVLHYPFPLDEDAMRAAAARFVGVHDFTSFAASTGSEEDDKERSTEREIFSTELARSPDNEELVFTVHGRSFLRYMVRKMVGTLLDVGPRQADAGRHRSLVRVEGSLEVRPDGAVARLVHDERGSRRTVPRLT